MARFDFSLGGYLVRIQKQAVVSLRTLHALDLAEDDRAAECRADKEMAPQGPGWFDSSRDLVHGLDVREGLPADARLNEWLAACLRAC